MKSIYCHNKNVGNSGEDMAVRYLEEKGYDIIDRNVTTPFGEIDIIARKDITTAFVEVKTRTNTNFGTGAESVDSRKKRAMLASAQYYIDTNGLLETPVRLDVIEITISKRSLRHIKDAIL